MMKMPRQLIMLNAALVVVAVAAVGYMIREMRVPAPTTPRRAAPPAAAGGATTPAAETPPGGYNVVASRNLFSPTRSEAPPPVGPAAANTPKPNLYGIILRDGAPLAYLEDPTTKRVAGYRLGDTIAGGTVTQIAADHVVLNRPDGDVNVRLRDPSKPRPAAPAAPQPAAGAPPVPTQPGGPPVATAPPAAAPQTPQPQSPGAQPATPGTPPVLPRRPLPPNLLRRLPPQLPSDAPAQN